MVSDVWQFCTRLANNRVRCDQCGRVMSYHGTTNLRVHVGRHYGLTPQLCKFSRSKGSIKLPQPNSTSGDLSQSPLPPEPQSQPTSAAACVRWHGYNTNMQTMFPKLLDEQRFVDVTLACDGQSVKCHKVILAACSPYFDELLCENPCKHPIVIVKGIKFWEMEALIEFMYQGEVKVEQDQLAQLLVAAEVLKIRGLAAGPFESSVQDGLESEQQDTITQSDSLNSTDEYIMKMPANDRQGTIKPSHSACKSGNLHTPTLTSILKGGASPSVTSDSANVRLPTTTKRVKKRVAAMPTQEKKTLQFKHEESVVTSVQCDSPESRSNTEIGDTEQVNSQSISEVHAARSPPLHSSKQKRVKLASQVPLGQLPQSIKLEPVDIDFIDDLATEYQPFEMMKNDVCLKAPQKSLKSAMSSAASDSVCLGFEVVSASQKILKTDVRYYMLPSSMGIKH